MFAQLGTIQFTGLQGFTEFSETRSTNIVEHARIEGKPRLQRVGSNLHELRVTVLLHASFGNPEQRYAALDTARENAEILPLILANGVYVSDYVITTLERSILQMDARSNIVSMFVTMQLKEAYNPNPQQRLSAAARQAAYATSEGGATPLRVVRPLGPTVGQSAVSDVLLAKMESSTINQLTIRADLAPNEKPSISKKVLANLNSINEACFRIQNAISDPTVNPFAGGLPSSIPTVQAAVNTMLGVIPGDSSLAQLKPLNATLQVAINNMVATSSILKNAIITRRI